MPLDPRRRFFHPLRGVPNAGGTFEPALPPERAALDGLRVLQRRPELCVAETRGMMLAIHLSPVRAEWAAATRLAFVGAANQYGGARPFIAVMKLDKRFPLEFGFDQNFPELRRELNLTRPYLRACAVVVTFGGLMGTVMRHSMKLVGFVSREKTPMQVCSTPAEAICWIEPHAAPAVVGPFERAHFVHALREMEALLGCED